MLETVWPKHSSNEDRHHFVSEEHAPPGQAQASGLVDQEPLDQLIQEGAWVHVSFAVHRRNEVLTAHFGEAGVTYTQGLA